MDIDKTKIMILECNKKFIIKVGNKYHDEIPYLTYLEAKNKVDNIINKYGKSYEFIEIIS